ncbi:helical backbone metal receptor [Lewinella cohaerens]|uniref:helical backbone metal receptor n=1 Tax=Lewinella cohaerens TaxID=70995 RepID=UPI00036C92AA|nr:helical backbone metal receptor [Lewinella cohaerens]
MNKKLLLDQLERTVSLKVYPPQRIVSLVPSQTELLADLGLGDSVVGITKFCVHPSSWRKEKTIIGGTKQLHLDRIRSLKPDLIIANQEENDREQVEALAVDFPVWVSKVVDLSTALNMIAGVGEATNTRTSAEDLMLKIKTSFASLRSFPTHSCAYLIWRKPYMVSGGDTFIQAMMEVAGFENVFGHQNRYPEVTMEELAAADPEWILLSSEPFPFKEKHLTELSVVCPNAKIRLVDGEMFSWYGSRLLRSADYFRILREAN